MKRLPVVLSATALVVAVFGSTPLGHSVSNLYTDRKSDRTTSAVSNVRTVYKYTNSNKIGSKSKAVQCPGSTKAIAGGIEIAAPREEGIVSNYDGPIGQVGKTPTGWFGAAHDLQLGPSDTEWSLGVFAICAKVN